ISQEMLSTPFWYFLEIDPNDCTIKTAISRLKPISQQKATSSVQLQEFDVFVNDYLKNWDVLTLPNGYLLWDTTKEVLIDLLNAEIAKSDEYGRKLLTDLTAANTDNDVILFHLLPSLCCKKTRGVKVCMPSLAEARKAFILHVLVIIIRNQYSYFNETKIKYMKSLFSKIFLQIPGDLNRQVKAHREWLASRGLNLQPTLIFVGPSLLNITASYVQIDAVRYELRTPLKALDTCFKAFHALDAAYQEECQAVWLFIQRYFYDLYLKEDCNIPRVTSILSSLKGLISKIV
ncbi:hypothetical protein ALC57_07545, partial [Trachymyrmex cornetzi]